MGAVKQEAEERMGNIKTLCEEGFPSVEWIKKLEHELEKIKELFTKDMYANKKVNEIIAASRSNEELKVIINKIYEDGFQDGKEDKEE